jgi:hypothetical protein
MSTLFYGAKVLLKFRSNFSRSLEQEEQGESTEHETSFQDKVECLALLVGIWKVQIEYLSSLSRFYSDPSRKCQVSAPEHYVAVFSPHL